MLRLLALCSAVSAFWAPGTRLARPWHRSPALLAAPDANKVFVRNIAWKADVQLLREEMERFGEVRDAHMPLTDGVHRGFGFVTFDSAAAALAAIEEGTVNLLGRGATISPAKAPDAKNKPTDSQSPRAIRQGLIANLRKARRRQDVERAIEALGSLDNAKEITMAMAAWGRAREPQRALALLEEMQSRGFEPNVIAFNVAISACEKGKQSERALELLNEMRARGVQPDVISFSAAISACVKGRQWERALELLEEMKSRGVEPDVIIYSAAISACEKGGQWERAIGLLEEMRTQGLEPNVISFSAAISACEKGGKWERALALLDEMRTRGLEPNVISFNAAISACEKGEQWERALELLEEMPTRGLEPDVISFSAAISACEKGGQWKRALELLTGCKTAGCGRVISFAPPSRRARRADSGSAAELLEEMQSRGLTGRGCVQRGDLGVCEGAQWERALSARRDASARRPAERGQLQRGDLGLRKGRPVGGARAFGGDADSRLGRRDGQRRHLGVREGRAVERALELLDEMPTRGVSRT